MSEAKRVSCHTGTLVCLRAEGFRVIKFVCAVFLLLVGLGAPRASHAQVAAYGEFSVTDLHNLVSTDFLYGVTTGLLVDGPKLLDKVVLQGNLQGRFVGGNGESMNGLTVGPRLSLPLHRGGIAPYGEFLIGFARFSGNASTAIYNGTGGNHTTDATLQVNVGLTKKLSPHMDIVGDYSYAQYYAYGGQYNPKTFSIGAVYHFVKR